MGGGGPHFDMVTYHFYPSYFRAYRGSTLIKYDYDLYGNGKWQNWGGGTVGKARFLKQVLTNYGYAKPIVFNETSLGCINEIVFPGCNPPDDIFFDVQADHLVRTYVRGLAEGVAGFSWFTLDDTGWRYTGLVEQRKKFKPAFLAYQELIDILKESKYQSPSGTGPVSKDTSSQAGFSGRATGRYRSSGRSKIPLKLSPFPARAW